MKALNIGQLTGRDTITGVSGGQRVLDALKTATDEHAVSAPLVLDFAGVEVLTGSAIRHMLQGLRAQKSIERTAIVLANLSPSNVEEADLVAQALRQPYITAQYDDGELKYPTLRGPLDAKVARTLELLIEAGEADAQTLSRASNEATVVTVWNNRLAALQSLGLLRERKEGKRKFYSTLLEGLTYGNRLHTE